MGESCVWANRFSPDALMSSTFGHEVVAAVCCQQASFFFHAERFFFAGFVFRNRVHFVAL
jgi:hypothetical protein